MGDKPIQWIGTAKEDVSAFPLDAKRRIGFELRKIQRGQPPTDSKPMSVIGSGVEEIRVRIEGAYRIFYIARFREAVYVLHGFQKKTQKTSQKDINLGQKRYQLMVKLRGEQ